MDVMEHLAADLSCALEDTKNKRSRHWKHRRSRSTSNLLGSGAGVKTESDDSSSDENKSDNPERSFARLTLQNKTQAKFSKASKIPMQCVVESDSFNELFGGIAQPGTSQTRRRRKHKRMAVDASELNDAHWCDAGLSAVAPVFPEHSVSSSSTSKSKKKVAVADPQVTIDFGKRKRGHKDRPVESSSTGEGSFSAGDKLNGVEDYMDEDMRSNEDDTSSVFSSDDAEEFHVTCDEGQEGDDEQSDWVGEEWLAEEGDSPERRRDLIMRRLRIHAPSREIRAGKRRVHPQKPLFSCRTSANEQISKFLQDPEQLELKLHPMRKSERIQLGHIANLYSLQMHYHLEEDDSAKGFTCPILTKTSNTAQMDSKSADEESAKTAWLGPLWTESDSKRIKK